MAEGGESGLAVTLDGVAVRGAREPTALDGVSATVRNPQARDVA